MSTVIDRFTFIDYKLAVFEDTGVRFYCDIRYNGIRGVTNLVFVTEFLFIYNIPYCAHNITLNCCSIFIDNCVFNFHKFLQI